MKRAVSSAAGIGLLAAAFMLGRGTTPTTAHASAVIRTGGDTYTVWRRFTFVYDVPYLVQADSPEKASAIVQGGGGLQAFSLGVRGVEMVDEIVRVHEGDTTPYCP